MIEKEKRTYSHLEAPTQVSILFLPSLPSSNLLLFFPPSKATSEELPDSGIARCNQNFGSSFRHQNRLLRGNSRWQARWKAHIFYSWHSIKFTTQSKLPHLQSNNSQLFISPGSIFTISNILCPSVFRPWSSLDWSSKGWRQPNTWVDSFFLFSVCLFSFFLFLPFPLSLSLSLSLSRVRTLRLVFTVTVGIRRVVDERTVHSSSRAREKPIRTYFSFSGVGSCVLAFFGPLFYQRSNSFPDVASKWHIDHWHFSSTLTRTIFFILTTCSGSS